MECNMQATFLTLSERHWLDNRQIKHRLDLQRAGAQTTVKQGLLNPRVWYSCLLKIVDDMPQATFLYWLPLMVSSPPLS